MEITITLQDDKDGQVQVEEVRWLSPGEQGESVTAASALAEEIVSPLHAVDDRFFPFGGRDAATGLPPLLSPTYPQSL